MRSRQRICICPVIGDTGPAKRGGISVSQRLELTGGTFNLNTGLNYLRSVGESVFTNPSRQDVVNIGFTIPIVDWGIRKEQLNMARNNLKATKLPIHSE